MSPVSVSTNSDDHLNLEFAQPNVGNCRDNQGYELISMEPVSSIDQALAHYRNGDIEAAIGELRTVTTSQPESALAWDYLGVILRSNKDLDGARHAGAQATRLDPKSAQAWNNFGNTLAALGQDRQAHDCYEQALELLPTYGDAWANKGLLEKRLGQAGEAKQSLTSAAQQFNQSAPTLNTIGNHLFDLESYDAAASCYQQATLIDPQFVNAHNNLGNTHLKCLRLEEAITSYKDALACDANHREAANGLAQCLLLNGNYRDGWAAYETRRATIDVLDNIAPWAGGRLQGKNLLIYTEQGAGDTIQFLRFIKRIPKGNSKTILFCPPDLADLVSQTEGIDQVVCSSANVAADLSVPLMSLPYLLACNDAGDFKMTTPYIEARSPCQITSPNTKIGIVWAGNPNHVNDQNRSTTLDEFAPIVHATNADFYSLQFGPAKAPSANTETSKQIIDLTENISNYADTANLIAALDLVITVDTSIAHLAGAMGKPCWVLLPYVPDWRWLLNTERSVWYPSLKLYRQSKRGIWADVIQRIISELRIAPRHL